MAANEEILTGLQVQYRVRNRALLRDADRQGKGVGAALDDNLVRSRQESWRRSCDLASGVARAPWAIGFYERMGFAIVGKNFLFRQASRPGSRCWPALSKSKLYLATAPLATRNS